jgi:hypothetical protein
MLSRIPEASEVQMNGRLGNPTRALDWQRLACVVALACAAASANAGPRVILVNGELLDGYGLQLVDRLNCGSTVPNGSYWLDANRREWGYVGRVGRYPLPDCSAAAQAAQSRSPSRGNANSDCQRARTFEDRMVYCHGFSSELNNGLIELR